MKHLLRRFLAIGLALLMTPAILSACGSRETAPTTPPQVTEPAEEAKVLKVLTLGHSLAVDTNHMLNLVCATEGIGDYEEIKIATLYYSGCKLSQHVQFISTGAAEYNLYLSSTNTPDQPPEILHEVSMLDALRYDYWDIIVMMGNPWEIDADSGFTGGNVQIIQKYVNDNIMNPLAIYAWHMPWAMPGDEDLLNMYPYDPNPHYNNYLAYNLDKTAHYAAQADCVERYILTDETFKFIIPTGTAIQNAWSSYMEEKDLHRDYAHATDFGRIMTSYVWYCKLLGIEKLEDIKVDAIPKQFLKSTEDKSVDRPLTQAEKDMILESVNNALAQPLQMTQSQYTTAPRIDRRPLIFTSSLFRSYVL